MDTPESSGLMNTLDHLAATDEVLLVNQRLLRAIGERDWATYQELCDPGLTAFEPESMGQLVEGLDFHAFYFKLGGGRNPNNTTMCNPRVRLLGPNGDVAVVTYVRLTQRIDSGGDTVTVAMQETRVWERQNGKWRHVHFHRSPSAGTQ
jgi:calcium/calmodulin-dependent protein kinase (CaM kinase) II